MTNSDICDMRRAVDIVFCVDGTGSMSPCIESVKSNARRFISNYEQMTINYNHCRFKAVDMAAGLGDIDFKDIIGIIPILSGKQI